MARRLLLVGVMVLVYPGEMEQLLLGVILSAIFCFFQVLAGFPLCSGRRSRVSGVGAPVSGVRFRYLIRSLWVVIHAYKGQCAAAA